MRTHQISASATIAAPAARVYSIIADYRNGHPQIVPRPPFGDIVVEQGGVGAGTVIQFPMRVMGRTRTLRGIVSEPEPVRVLVESYPEDDMVTTFMVEPLGDRECRVTITTDMKIHRGPIGWIEGGLSTRFLRPVFERELRLLEDVAKKQTWC
jgi:hypothetical protein